MILSNTDIIEEIRDGGLRLAPMVEYNQIAASSIDLRLSGSFTLPIKPGSGISITVDPEVSSPEDAFTQYGEEVSVPMGGKFELKPGDFVLGYTLERVELPNYLAARIEGRSRLARFGVSVHQTAPTVHARFRGQLRLEISNIGPFTVLLEPGSRFCQLIIERLDSPAQEILPSQWQDQGSSE